MPHPRALPRLGDADLALLRVFVTVVECGGFTAARSELNVSQSTISTQMAVLETRLGVRLCERGRRGFRLTPEGQRAYAAAVDLFRAVDSFRTEIGAVSGRIVGDLHLGVVDATISNRDIKLNEALARLHRDAPEVHLYLHVATALELEMGLIENRFHAVIGPMQKRRPELAYAVLPPERQDLYCGRSSPLFDLAPDQVPPARLAEVPFARRGYLADWTPPNGLPLSLAATTDNMEATARLILGGAYIGYLPSHYAQFWVERGEMRPILPALAGYDSRFFVAAPRSGRGLPVRWFLSVFSSIQSIPDLA